MFDGDAEKGNLNFLAAFQCSGWHSSWPGALAARVYQCKNIADLK